MTTKKYTYTTTDNNLLNFGECSLRLMGNRFPTRGLTLDEAKKEQKEMQKKIDDLELRANPKKGKVKKRNK